MKLDNENKEILFFSLNNPIHIDKIKDLIKTNENLNIKLFTSKEYYKEEYASEVKDIYHVGENVEVSSFDDLNEKINKYKQDVKEIYKDGVFEEKGVDLGVSIEIPEIHSLDKLYSVLMGNKDKKLVLFQDDATMDYHLKFYNKEKNEPFNNNFGCYGVSLNQVIDHAFIIDENTGLSVIECEDKKALQEKMRHLMGYVQNGTQTTLNIQFDEDKGVFVIKFYDGYYSNRKEDIYEADSFQEVIEKAYKKRENYYD